MGKLKKYLVVQVAKEGVFHVVAYRGSGGNVLLTLCRRMVQRHTTLGSAAEYNMPTCSRCREVVAKWPESWHDPDRVWYEQQCMKWWLKRTGRDDNALLGECPCCGEELLSPREEDNSLSRFSGLYICTLCGEAEALGQSRPLPLIQPGSGLEELHAQALRRAEGRKKWGH